MSRTPPVPRDAVTLYKGELGGNSSLIPPDRQQNTYRHGALVILNDENAFCRAIHSAYMRPYLERSYQHVTLLHLGKELKRTESEAANKHPVPKVSGKPIGKKLSDQQRSNNSKRELKIVNKQFTLRDKLRADIIRKSVDSTLNGASSIDVYICSHTNQLHSVFKSLGTSYLSRFRLVWNAGCGNGHKIDGSEWLKTGIKAYIGHVGPLSLSPIWVHMFLQYWVGPHKNITVDAAVKKANGGTAVFKQTQAHLYGRKNMTFGKIK